MFFVKGKEEKEAKKWMREASRSALSSTCLRAMCGSVIVKDGKVIGRGFNSLPGNKRPERCLKDDLPAGFKSDRTCCIHAEDRAISDALIAHPKEIRGSRIYFIRLNTSGKREFAGNPYCTTCSKRALDAGIAEFALWHKEGICIYDTEEYNRLSFECEG
jgi:deoxycytidylate deaminase